MTAPRSKSLRRCVAPEAVELPDSEDVALTEMVEAGIEMGSPGCRTALTLAAAQPLAHATIISVRAVVLSINFTVVQVDSTYPENIVRLRTVITKALAWVQTERERAAEELRTTMESWDREELFALAEARGELPNVDSVHHTRR